VQENLTMQIADGIEHHLEPAGVAVVLEAEHLCMTIRGAQSPGTKTRTAEMRGVFADHEKTAKAEFLSSINGH
jgi:GTP cyclohydrolase I